MSYIDGFVMAVPTANRQNFIDHAGLVDTCRYERHRPEQTLLYQLVAAHYPALVEQLASRVNPYLTCPPGI
jgi:hypothetical protein